MRTETMVRMEQDWLPQLWIYSNSAICLSPHHLQQRENAKTRLNQNFDPLPNPKIYFSAYSSVSQGVEPIEPLTHSQIKGLISDGKVI